MALQTLIKVSINNLSDARYCAGMGVEMLGFCLDKNHKNYVAPKDFQEIVSWVEGVKIVGEMSQVPEDLAQYHLDFLEIQDIKLIEHFKDSLLPIILKIDLSQDSQEIENILSNTQNVQYFVLFTENTLSDGLVEKVKNWAKRFPIFLEAEILASEALHILENTQIKGLVLKGGDEIRPGYKDFEKLADILETITIED